VSSFLEFQGIPFLLAKFYFKEPRKKWRIRKMEIIISILK